MSVAVSTSTLHWQDGTCVDFVIVTLKILMITCPSCNHQNPEGSLQCENCYTPLPASTSCPNCGASVQTDATFCGQCGFNLQAENSATTPSLEETIIGSSPDLDLGEISLPDEMPISSSDTGNDLDESKTTVSEQFDNSPWDDPEEEKTTAQVAGLPNGFPEVETAESTSYVPEPPETEFIEYGFDSSEVEATFPSESLDMDLDLQDDSTDFEPFETSPNEVAKPETKQVAQNLSASAVSMSGATQLQIQRAALLHLQSNTSIEIPSNLDVVHFGKPNGQIPPDIDVSGFPDSEVVSRVHADIRIEGDAYYVEDTGSSNGTYINHAPLQKGNRHRLRNGDRVALGKGDLVTFIFQLQ